ncbi:hypothetical protein DFP72DRAFT_843285 [Ephemerocybe angulata]|uniref:Uncharacterized protein n=1 Tax=Ephemerocybe angulata TaxID=980116 RepID=A0A8H6M913_9AGAR|nr:hypothetical protein DFP72DRAFT_843285 [Tulosesus angulatus]
MCWCPSVSFQRDVGRPIQSKSHQHSDGPRRTMARRWDLAALKHKIARCWGVVVQGTAGEFCRSGRWKTCNDDPHERCVNDDDACERWAMYERDEMRRGKARETSEPATKTDKAKIERSKSKNRKKRGVICKQMVRTAEEVVAPDNTSTTSLTGRRRETLLKIVARKLCDSPLHRPAPRPRPTKTLSTSSKPFSGTSASYYREARTARPCAKDYMNKVSTRRLVGFKEVRKDSTMSSSARQSPSLMSSVQDDRELIVIGAASEYAIVVAMQNAVLVVCASRTEQGFDSVVDGHGELVGWQSPSLSSVLSASRVSAPLEGGECWVCGRRGGGQFPGSARSVKGVFVVWPECERGEEGLGEGELGDSPSFISTAVVLWVRSRRHAAVVDCEGALQPATFVDLKGPRGELGVIRRMGEMASDCVVVVDCEVGWLGVSTGERGRCCSFALQALKYPDFDVAMDLVLAVFDLAGLEESGETGLIVVEMSTVGLDEGGRVV